MPRYSIVPLDQADAPIDVVSPNAASILHMISRRDFLEADVLCDGEYAFSVILHENGFWTIFERESRGSPGPVPVRI
jgi:hypothetical protein